MKRYFWISFAFFLAMAGLNVLLNHDFSVMGAKDASITEMVKNEFFPTILSSLGIIAAIIVALSLLASLYLKFVENVTRLSTLTIVLFLSVFHLSLNALYAIYFPQYLAEFLNGNAVFAFFFHPIIDHFSPYFFVFVLSLYGVLAFAALVARYSFAFAACISLLAAFSLHLLYFVSNKPQTGEKLNVLVLMADSFQKEDARRLDVLGKLKPHGNIVEFGAAYTAMPRTFSSIVSIFTAQYPMNHHIYNMFPPKKFRDGQKANAMPRLYREAGYHTEVISDFAGDVFSRIDLGFDERKTPYFNFNTLIEQTLVSAQLSFMPYLMTGATYSLLPSIRGIAKLPRSDRLAAETIAAIRGAEKPFLITTFFSDAHFPYSAPYPYYRRSGGGYNGAFKYMKNRSIVDEELTNADIEQIQYLFRAAERSVADRISDILNALVETGKIKNTLVVFLADHGENLYEYKNTMGHGEHLYDDATTNIPLLLFAPTGVDLSQLNNNQLLSTIDVFPTVNAITGINSPSDVDGQAAQQLGGDATRFMESGLWFVNNTTEFFQDERIMYPNLTELMEIEWGNNNEPALKADYLIITEKAKHRAVLTQTEKLFYIPLEDRIVWRYFKDGKERELDGEHASRIDALKRIFFNHFAKRFDVRNDYLYLK